MTQIQAQEYSTKALGSWPAKALEAARADVENQSS